MNQKQRLFTPQFVVLFLALFVSGYCLYCLNSTVPLYVDSIGGAAKASGVLNTCFTVCACVARLVGGHCADRFGRKRIIIAGGLFIAAGTFAYSAITSFPMLMIFRGVQGVGYAMMSVGSATALIDVLPKDRLGEGIGISAVASTVAGSIAPTVGLAIVTGFDFKTVFVTTSAVAVCGVLSVLLFCNYEKKKPLAHAGEAVTEESPECSVLWRVLERKAVLPAAVYTLFSTGFSITYVFMTLYAVSSGIVNPGSYFIASSLCQVFARIIAGKVADRENVLPVVVAGGVLSCLSYLGLALTTNSGIYLLCGALFGVGNGLIGPVMNRLAVMDAEPKRRGAASATYSISADIGNGLGGMLWGALIDVVPYCVCFGIVSVWMLGAMGAAVMFLIFRSRKKEDNYGQNKTDPRRSGGVSETE